MVFRFQMTYAAMPLCKPGPNALCCVTAVPRATKTCCEAGEAQHWRRAGEEVLFLTAPVPVTAFISAPQLSAWLGSLTH